MKLDQVAFYCATKAQAADLKAMLGLVDAEWIKDKVTAQSSVYGREPAENIAELEFNYSFGMELEIIRYISGPNWHGSYANKSERQFISHVGFHLEDGEEFPEMPGCELVQETFTNSHTSEYLVSGAGAGRLYHYRIFALSPGHYVKYIRRIHPAKE